MRLSIWISAWMALLQLFACRGEMRAAEPPSQSPPRNPAEPVDVVTADNDREREQAAERAERRMVCKLTRGPYLQFATPGSMVVRWRTDVPGANAVRFGLGETNLRFTARAHGTFTEHVVLLTNLLPATRYFYALATNTFGGTNKAFPALTNSFVTPPLAGPARPMRVWALGDPGTRTSVQKAVREAFQKFNGDHPLDFILLLGDNAYMSGTDAEYQGSIFEAYASYLRQHVLWPSMGNHDDDSANSPTQTGTYFDLFTVPTLGQAGGVMSGTKAYYSFDHANVHFICLDSCDTDRSTNGFMWRWLKADLAANKRPWTIAFWHHPPHTKGSHDSDNDKDGGPASRELRERFMPLLDAGGLDLCLFGHSHNLERSWLVDGFYSRSTNFNPRFFKDPGDGREDGDGAYHKSKYKPVPREGAVLMVAGSAGQTSGIRGAHPIAYNALNIPGSLVIDIDGPRLDATFIDTNGFRRDYFTILKGADSPSPRWSSLSKVLKAAASSNRWDILLTANPTDRQALLKAYRTSTNLVMKQNLTWTLAAMADAQVATELMGVITNKVRDRIVTAEEDDLRLTTIQALGLLAARYEPIFPYLKKGVSADWWYFRTNWVSVRPLELTAARAATCTIQALSLSGRPEAIEFLERGRKNYLDFTFGEPAVVFRNYAREHEEATNRLARFRSLDRASWPRGDLAEEIKRLKWD